MPLSDITQDEILDLDIADVFADLSRALGFEGKIDTYAGLWSTQYVCDEHSLLVGDFLQNGLRLDLLCDASVPIPFVQIFSCMQYVLSQVAECEMTEFNLVCEPYSVGSRNKKSKVCANWQSFREFSRSVVCAPTGSFSAIRYKAIDRNQHELLSGEDWLPDRKYHLQELALFISALWSDCIGDSLRNAEKVQIAIV